MIAEGGAQANARRKKRLTELVPVRERVPFK